ncbi:hypothetical protein K437DRAFT_253883 [Tilletiaria anomala UBC 951]|uniref:RING-type E3 ubiquitin transferase n=1 Tax=Tilletiaria anomala (strain ATCC 24038 / CBS 436.72 / UBC 951) TaxID=1037660 RepID=A0A066WNV9_TILAU|nr:uncharacterized protein K437DRAFT_253883 [Tilletiaria anomala UBC 951]KDN52689.1 hypothetical protein K437DRAFT_253883 [Tilletiaria anomala UBC 951]
MDSATSSDAEPFCLICLGLIVDRTILPSCSHGQFCFNCIHKWAALRRTCPLCNAPMGPFLIHDIHGKHDYSRFYLRPAPETTVDEYFRHLLASTPSSSRQPALSESTQRSRKGHRGNYQCRDGRAFCSPPISEATLAEAGFQRVDEEVAFRRRIYRCEAYAKHVGCNRYSRYSAPLKPDQIAKDTDAQHRATVFIRRELRVWPNLDIEFLTSYCVQILKSIDLQSDTALRLLGDFLGDEVAHHFVHEVIHFLRSPFRTPQEWDRTVQHAPPLIEPHRDGNRRRHDEEADRRCDNTMHGRTGKRNSDGNIERDYPTRPFSDQEPSRDFGSNHDAAQPPSTRNSCETDVLSAMAEQPTSFLSKASPSLSRLPSTERNRILAQRQEVSQRRAKHLARLEREKQQVVATPPLQAPNTAVPVTHTVSIESAAPYEFTFPQRIPSLEAERAKREEELRGKLKKKKEERHEVDMCRRAREARLKCLLLTQRRKEGELLNATGERHLRDVMSTMKGELVD